jgi:hypothetical protein
MRVIEVNPGSSRSGAHVLKLIGEATTSHRVVWHDASSKGLELPELF